LPNYLELLKFVFRLILPRKRTVP